MAKRYLSLLLGLLLVNSLVLWLGWPQIVVFNIAFVVIGWLLAIQFKINIDSLNQLQHSMRQSINLQEQDYRLLADKTRLMIDQLPIGLALINDRGLVEWLNPSFKHFIRQPEETSVFFYSDLRFTGDVRQILRRAYEQQEAFLQRIKYQGLDYQCQAIKLAYKEQTLGMLVIIQDITKALVGEQLQQQFIADASHELKTPLSVIVGMLEILSREPGIAINDQQQFIQLMQQESQRLTRIVSDLVQMSKMTGLKDVLNLTKVNLKLIIDAVINEATHDQIDNKTIIINQLPADLEIMADQARIFSVFSNLMTNALVHSQTPDITISAHQLQHQIEITITDHGIGISEEDLPYIFDRFYRSDASRSRNTGGSGLGLAIVKDIISAHHGTIVVKSQLNHGTTFVITLPS